MLSLRKQILIAAAAIGIAGAAYSPASAGVISVTLDPSAPNTGCVPTCGTIDTSGTPQGAFSTSSVSFDYYAFLNINGSSGTNTFTESGALAINTFPNSYGPGHPIGDASVHYTIFATFTLTGSGTWSGGTFSVNGAGVTGFVMNVYAAPTGVTPTFAIPTTTGSTGATIPAGAFQIATVVPDLSALSTFTAIAVNLGGGVGTTFLSASLKIIPGTGFSGPTGFFQSPTPFLLDLSLSTSSTNLNTTTGGATTFTMGIIPGCTNFSNTGGCSAPNGTFQFVSVPEPSTLALFGMGLLGLGLFARRRVRRAA